jgi:hypothetical protein
MQNGTYFNKFLEREIAAETAHQTSPTDDQSKCFATNLLCAASGCECLVSRCCCSPEFSYSRWRHCVVFMKGVPCQPNEVAIMAKYGVRSMNPIW